VWVMQALMKATVLSCPFDVCRGLCIGAVYLFYSGGICLSTFWEAVLFCSDEVADVCASPVYMPGGTIPISVPRCLLG
jgi:hypothetical protein